MKELLTTKELMALLKTTRTTIAEWRKQGMPYKKYGKLVRFDRDDVDKWLEGRE